MILNLYTIGQIFAQLWKCTVKFHTCKWVFHSAYVVKSYQLIGCRQRLIYYPFLNSIIFWLYCLPLVGVGRGRIAITHMNMIFFFKNTQMRHQKWNGGHNGTVLPATRLYMQVTDDGLYTAGMQHCTNYERDRLPTVIIIPLSIACVF